MNSFTTNDTIYVTYGFIDVCHNDISVPFTNTIQLVKYASAQATTYSVERTFYDPFPGMRAGTWRSSRLLRINRPTAGYWGVRIELNSPRAFAETNTANNVWLVRYQVSAPTPVKALSRVAIVSGPSEVQDGATARYTAKAYFTDNTEADVTATANWSVSPANLGIFLSSGELVSRGVTNRTVVTVSATYAYNGVSKAGTRTVALCPPSSGGGGGTCPFSGVVRSELPPMTVFAQVMIDGEAAREGDVLAAFSADGQVRGKIELDAAGKRAINVYLTTPNESITFRVWSHLGGEVYPCMTPLTGVIGGERGTPDEPYVIDCGNDPFGVPVQYRNPPMAILARVVIKGEPAARGDRVGVFCGDELRAKGIVRVEDGIAKVTLAPSVSSNGETLTFKVWDASEEKLLNAAGSLRATSGGEVGSPSSRYLIEVSDTVSQALAFDGSPWQFVSVNVVPEEESPRAVFQSIIGDIDRITCGDKIFKPSWSDADNTLGSIVAGAGYWVKRATSRSVTVSITGLPADVRTTRISLVPGWNGIGYVPQMAGAVRTVLADVLASGAINRVVAGDQVFKPSWSDRDNTMTTMRPGIGYWVEASAPVTFAFNEPSGASSAAALAAVGDGASHPFGEQRDRDPVSGGSLLRAKLSLFGTPVAYGEATVAAYAVVGGVTNALPCAVAEVNEEGNVVMNVQKYLPFSVVFKVWDTRSGEMYDADTEIAFAVGEDEKIDETIAVTGAVPVYRVVFELSGVGAGSGVRTGGGALTQLVARASAAIAPMVVGNPGYEFLLWDEDFSCVKRDMVVHAVYKIDDEAPDVPDGPDGFGFDSSEATVEKGDAFELVVYGGTNAATAASVKVNVAYGTAKAADLDLRRATVRGANGAVEQTGLKFPLTLNWRRGDVEPKTITISTTDGKATDAPKALVWNLSDAQGRPMLLDRAYCIGTIAEGWAWDDETVSVMPYVADVRGGKVSGATSVRPINEWGDYRDVTLTATANKGYWFAGWYDGDGHLASTHRSFRVTPYSWGDSLQFYEARFIPARTTLCGTYNGVADVNLKGMTLVRNADTSSDVYGKYPFTVTLSTDGKVSGTVTVGGKKVALKGDSILADYESSVCFNVMADEKVCFGRANTEALELEFDTDGSVHMYCGVDWDDDEIGDYTPIGDAEDLSIAYKDVSKDKAMAAKFAKSAGTYAGAIALEDGGVVPVSIVVDKAGKAKVAGRYADGTTFSASGVFGRYDSEDHEMVELDVFATPKLLGAGAFHLNACDFVGEDQGMSLALYGHTTTYTVHEVSVVGDDDMYLAPRFTPGCWVPADANPDYGVVRLRWGEGEEVVDILYASKNGVITGLGPAMTPGVTVKFDARTGLLTGSKGREFVIQGVLGDDLAVAGIVYADGSRRVAEVSFETLPPPEEVFPWAHDDFVLCVGQNFGEWMQASVTGDGGSPFELTIAGLPAGLKYDRKSGLITGAPTKAGTSTVKVSYKFGHRMITRVTSLVVSDRPDDLPTGTYTGLATVLVDGDADKPVDYPFTATIDRNGALSGSIMLFGKKATFKAAGYDSCSAGVAEYESVALELKAVNRSWAPASLSLTVTADEISAWCDSFGPGHEIVEIAAWRNRSRDAGFAELVNPYVGRHVVTLGTRFDDDAEGVTALSVVIDKRGVVKVSGTFADGTPVSASSTLCVSQGEEAASAFVSIVPKLLAQGAMSLLFTFRFDVDEATGERALNVDCASSAAKYVLSSGDYASLGMWHCSDSLSEEDADGHAADECAGAEGVRLASHRGQESKHE
ncbi:MAG: putative Ig domain-containing protein [Kiritimatiellia bacterium]